MISFVTFYIFSKFLACLTFRGQKMLYYKVENLLMATWETVTMLQILSPSRGTSHGVLCAGQSIVCVFWGGGGQRPCLPPSLFNPYHHLTQSRAQIMRFLSTHPLNCTYSGKKGSFTKDTVTVLQDPFQCPAGQDNYLSTYQVRNVAEHG